MNIKLCLWIAASLIISISVGVISIFVLKSINLLNMIEHERESDKVQRELITNISHDLKTPLTIILGYLDIIRSKSYKTEEEQRQYLESAFNNLMNNALKYTPENGHINIKLKEDEAGALICFSNTCVNISGEDLNNLFNRFYRGDKARNSKIEGSGVGLSTL